MNQVGKVTNQIWNEINIFDNNHYKHQALKKYSIILNLKFFWVFSLSEYLNFYIKTTKELKMKWSKIFIRLAMFFFSLNNKVTTIIIIIININFI